MLLRSAEGWEIGNHGFSPPLFCLWFLCCILKMYGTGKSAVTVICFEMLHIYFIKAFREASASKVFPTETLICIIFGGFIFPS